jgi:hypothetical protein
MQGVLKTLGRSFSAHSRKGAVNQRRLGTKVLGGLVSVSLLLTSSAVFAEVTALELSPLVSKSTLVGRVDSNKEIGVLLGIYLLQTRRVWRLLLRMFPRRVIRFSINTSRQMNSRRDLAVMKRIMQH